MDLCFGRLGPVFTLMTVESVPSPSNVQFFFPIHLEISGKFWVWMLGTEENHTRKCFFSSGTG
jgi:hypothetical protein